VGASMGKGRLEAFSDGVIAIIITIMVLELRPPEAPTLEALRPVVPVFLAYVLSFINLGIYWNNHHHMLHATRSVTGGILWANLHLLFWLSLFPVVTRWVGEAPMTALPAAAYGGVAIMAAVAYTILSRFIIQHEGPASTLARATGKDWKGWISLACYVAGLLLSFISPLIAYGMYVLVAAIWFLPDRRIERVIAEKT